MLKSWRGYTKLVRQLLKGIIPERNSSGYLEKTIFLNHTQLYHTDKGEQKAELSGLMMMIFDRPGLMIGAKITITGKLPCYLCEEFDNLDMCIGADNQEECPIKKREIYIKSIECSYKEKRECICNINCGELRIDTKNRNKVSIEKLEIPWKNFKLPGEMPGA